MVRPMIPVRGVWGANPQALQISIPVTLGFSCKGFGFRRQVTGGQTDDPSKGGLCPPAQCTLDQHTSYLRVLVVRVLGLGSRLQEVRPTIPARGVWGAKPPSLVHSLASIPASGSITGSLREVRWGPVPALQPQRNYDVFARRLSVSDFSVCCLLQQAQCAVSWRSGTQAVCVCVCDNFYAVYGCRMGEFICVFLEYSQLLHSTYHQRRYMYTASLVIISTTVI